MLQAFLLKVYTSVIFEWFFVFMKAICEMALKLSEGTNAVNIFIQNSKKKFSNLGQLFLSFFS